MINSYPLITIGMPCYNSEETILRALKSALKQTWSNFEIILVDDCSTDNTVDVIEKELKKLQGLNIKFLSNSVNKGPGFSRQRILDISSGEFLVFFDDDDESYPNRIEEQYQAIISLETASDQQLIACYASGVRLYDSGYRKILPAIGSKAEPLCGKVVANYLLYHEVNSHLFYGSGTPSCSLMARVNTFNLVGGFDINLRRVEDIDFAIRLSIKGGCFVGTRQELFKQYSTHAIDKSPLKNLNAEQMLVSKFKEYLDKRNLFEYAYRWPKLRFFHFTNQYHLLLKELVVLIFLHPYRTINHFFRTGSKRLIHEFLIYKGKK
jgi:glycosyltransferase involved in cell wall biosynthesis